MMSSSHGFVSHVPNWAGFAVLIVVWVLFRGFLLRSRRNAVQRMRMQMGQALAPRQPAAPQVPGQVRCPRCAASASGVAMYCPHCGLAFGSIPPPPIPAQFHQPPRRGLLTLVWFFLGLIGLAAFLYWRFSDEPAAPAAPELPHVHIHGHYR